jgi:hypothetical protein
MRSWQKAILGFAEIVDEGLRLPSSIQALRGLKVDLGESFHGMEKIWAYFSHVICA